MPRQDAPPVDFPFTAPGAGAEDVRGLALLREAPVVRVRLPEGTRAWAVLGHAAAWQVLVDPRFSRSAAREPGTPRVGPALTVPDMLTGMDGPEHDATRQLIVRAMTPELVAGMRPWVALLVDELIDRVRAQRPPVDLVEHLAGPLPVMAIGRLLGVPYQDHDEFRRWTVAMTSPCPADADAARAAAEEFRRYVGQLADRKGRWPTVDLISALIRVGDRDRRLTRRQLVDNVLLIVLAGNDMTAHQLAGGLVRLLSEPALYARLVATPDLVPAAVEELLRHLLLIPAGLLTRVATEDVELAGASIRAGEAVIVVQHLANRDPRAFAHPDRFDLCRDDTALHLSFGAGPHYCVGAQLARMEMTVALTLLTERLPGLRLAVPAAEVEWRRDGLLRGPVRVPVGW